MSKKTNFILAFSSLVALTGGSIFAVSNGTPFKLTRGAAAEHEGYHYDRVESTCKDQGHLEFWTCCTCGEHFTSNPGGKFTDRGTDEAFAGGFPEDVLLDLADHSFNYTVPTDKIGNKTGVCKWCDEGSIVPMTADDIDLTKDVNAYGCNAQGFVGGTEEGNRGLSGGLFWVNNSDSTATSEIKFPKVDFTLYSNVLFEFGTSTATWGGSQVRLSINEKNDLLNLSGVAGIYGAIEVSYDKNNSKLIIISRTSTSDIKTVEVTDNDVITGKSSLTGNLELGTYRMFYLNKIEFNHSEHEYENFEAPVASKTVIGYKIGGQCKLCLANLLSNELMANEDINLAYGYGAGVDGLPGYHAFDGEKITFGDGNTSIGTIYLPRVNFEVYSEVKFNMGHNNLWGQLGFDSEHTFGGFDNSNPDRSIALTVTKGETSYDVSLDCPSKSIHLETTLTDSDVINGSASFTLYLNLGPYSVVNLRSINVTK